MRSMYDKESFGLKYALMLLRPNRLKTLLPRCALEKAALVNVSSVVMAALTAIAFRVMGAWHKWMATMKTMTMTTATVR